jgi:hypothetical protein
LNYEAIFLFAAAKLRVTQASIQIMKHKIYLFIYIIFFGLNHLFAQSNFNGNWEGTITMEKEGKVVATFKFILYLIQDSSKVEGRSWIWHNESKAIFSIKGICENNQLTISDLQAIEADPIPSGEWCMKNMNLKQISHKKNNKLEGTWQGKTSFSSCTPGKIYLKKINNRV